MAQEWPLKPLEFSKIAKKMTEGINICWWNANDFYHFDPSMAAMDRWPSSESEYLEKCKRVDAALLALFDKYGMPDLLALGEISNAAANALQNRLLKGYLVKSLDVDIVSPSLQVAVFYAKNNSKRRFTEVQPIVPAAVPRGTRPMSVTDISLPNTVIRCIACHWNAKIGDNSETTRARIADALAIYVYEFLNKKPIENRHIIILGDLNDEPYGVPHQFLHGHMHRSRSMRAAHWADHDMKRVHLYNCAWRLFGENNAHSPGSTSLLENAAGTYFWEKKNAWSVIDQIIVSGGLLTHDAPYIDEATLVVGSLPEFMPDGLPLAFSKTAAGYKGLSDHLPIIAKIVTQE